ncbi:MAG TPA: type II toxin-antitoxin system HicB family antitoxin [Aggregatilineales bacterium]|nr:type II toxin-antitoxin system HicB family antitoxin [Anaerolineales bacterium]HRE47973.1 type II toxin-antitoxin system HicB family antitoxin [Aggregatilineales bacterium]
MRQIVLYPDPESNFWIAECPSLPGCVTQGETCEDAIRAIQDAIQGVIAVMEEAGDW